MKSNALVHQAGGCEPDSSPSEPVFGAGSADFMPVKSKGAGGGHIV